MSTCTCLGSSVEFKSLFFPISQMSGSISGLVASFLFLFCMYEVSSSSFNDACAKTTELSQEQGAIRRGETVVEEEEVEQRQLSDVLIEKQTSR